MGLEIFENCVRKQMTRTNEHKATLLWSNGWPVLPSESLLATVLPTVL